MLPITVQQVSNIRQISTSDEAVVGILIGVVSSIVESYCNRTFEKTDYNKLYNGNGLDYIFVENYPINSITSLTEEDKNGTTTYTYASTEYVFNNEGIITLRGYRFTSGLQNIRIQYNAGYQSLPKDLEYACIQFVLFLYNDRRGEKLGIRYKALGDGGTEAYQVGIPDKVKMVLNMYKKRNVIDSNL